jgi:large subunit ribosomal protein L10
MARPEKVAVVDEIREKLAASDAAVLTEYRGLKVGELAELRGALRPAGAEFKIFKNTLARRAAEQSGLDDLVPMFGGPTAITFVNGDAVIAAKALRDFSRAHEALVVKGGLLGDRTLSSGDLVALADVPPREELLARLAGGFQAPMVKAAGLFQAFTRNFAYGVKALVDQRVAAGETLPEAPAEAAVAPTTEPGTSPEPAAEAPTEAAAEAAPTEAPTEAPETETAPTEGE